VTAGRTVDEGGADLAVEPSERVAPRRATTLTLTAGALVGAACFAVAVVTDLLGVDGSAATGAADGSAFVAELAALRPWAWASLGSVAIIATPAVGLVMTAVEYNAIADRRAVLMALAVLAVLGISLLVALLA
jgi:uncharacterized membrane protein